MFKDLTSLNSRAKFLQSFMATAALSGCAQKTLSDTLPIVNNGPTTTSSLRKLLSLRTGGGIVRIDPVIQMQQICESYFYALYYALLTQYMSTLGGVFPLPPIPPTLQTLSILTTTFAGTGGSQYPFTSSDSVFMQQLVNTLNSHTELRTTLSNATTIGDAAACLGGIAGVVMALALNIPALPVELAAAGGIVIVGAAAYIYASANPSLQPTDLATAMSDASWPAGQAGTALDLATRIKGITGFSGSAPYGFIAGGVIGAISYYASKYFPSFLGNVRNAGPNISINFGNPSAGALTSNVTVTFPCYC